MNKAKIARTLACKTSLSARVDAFVAQSESGGDVQHQDVASKLWSKMQRRMRHVEGREVEVVSKSLAGQMFMRHEFGGKTEGAHDEADDFKLKKKKKRKREEEDSDDEKV